MNLWFLPYVREGFRPSSDGSSATVAWRAQARINTSIAAAGQPVYNAATSFDLLGPGDVIGIDAAQILRVLPPPNTNRAEPDFFPCVELDAPDLPWTYSPMAPSGNRLMPWICLIVVEQQDGVSLRPGDQGQSPWILSLAPAQAAHELPDLTEAWAWAHTQVTCETQAEIGGTLANHPDSTLSRLLAPRRLLPQKRYIGCIVPTFLAGRTAGLGGDPEATATQMSLNLAWSSTRVPTELPVYYTWSFSTGDSGNVESLLRQLHPPQVRADAARLLNVRIASADATLVVDWQPPLRLQQHQSTHDPRPPAIVAGISAALASTTADAPVVGPPYLGEPWVTGRPLDPITSWTPSLNLTPMARAAAGLGADLVRNNQEDLVAAVWEQFTAYRQDDQRQRVLQLSTIVENQVKDRLQAAPLEEASRVLGPAVVQAQPNAKSVGLRTAVGRRVTSKSWRVAHEIAAREPAQPRALVTRLEFGITPTGAAALNGSLAAAPPPVADKQTLLAKEDASYQGSRFAPQLATPLSEIFADRFRELLLPSTAQMAPDSILAVEVDRGFVEAFLVGANQEFNRELLWRGLPADPRATAFRHFWHRTDQGKDEKDIPAIADWPASKTLGDNAAPMDAGVLLRSEIVHRCPSLLVAAVPAYWDNGKRRPCSKASAVMPAVIRTIIGNDLLYVGFAGLTLTEMIGQSSTSGPAGWFIMLAENPVDPRFGLDPPVTPAKTPAPGNLSWSNVVMAAGDSYAPARGLPAIPSIRFSFATADGAIIAYIMQQRQFRAFLHASVLVGPGSS